MKSKKLSLINDRKIPYGVGDNSIKSSLPLRSISSTGIFNLFAPAIIFSVAISTYGHWNDRKIVKSLNFLICPPNHSENMVVRLHCSMGRQVIQNHMEQCL